VPSASVSSPGVLTEVVTGKQAFLLAFPATGSANGVFSMKHIHCWQYHRPPYVDYM
jgi:hypothetical protein